MAGARHWLAAAVLCLICLLGRPVWAQSDTPTVSIDWPNEAERLYAGPSSMLYKVPVKGRVTGFGPSAEGLSLRLDVIQGGQVINSLTSRLDSEGDYLFEVTVNPDHPLEQFEIAFGECGRQCHSPGELDLVPGPLTLQVTATAADGRRAAAERHIVVDISGQARVPVQLVLDGQPGQAVSGVPVSASTWIYLWRARFGHGESDENGLAQLTVEALSQAPTEYVIKVGPTIVDGTLYEGTKSLTVSLPPGATEHPTVTLPVTARQGSIEGQVDDQGDDACASQPVWAVRLPDGTSSQTAVDEQGRFTFDEVPLDSYLVTLDQGALSLAGWQSQPQTIDLTEAIDGRLSLPVERLNGRTVAGSVGDGDDHFLPFAWVAVEEGEQTAMVMPEDGSFLLSGLPAGPATLLIHAPGYYSQLQSVQPDQDTLAVALEVRPEMATYPWGDGSLHVPPETLAEVGDRRVTISSGWLWGAGAGTDLTVQAGDVAITMDGGRFALEYLPGRRGWLYVLEGQADVRRRGGPVIAAGAGQMVNLLNSEGLAAVDCRAAVVSALRSDTQVPFSPQWPRSIGAQIRDRLARLGIGTAQVVTFVTYFLFFLSIIVVPLGGLYWWWKRRG